MEKTHEITLREELNDAQAEIVSMRVLLEAMRGKFKAMRGEVAATNKKVEAQALRINAMDMTIKQLRELNTRYADKYTTICAQWQCDRAESVENAKQMTEVLAAARKHEYLLTRMCNVLVNDWLTDEQRKLLLEGKDYEEIRRLTLARRTGRGPQTTESSSDLQQDSEYTAGRKWARALLTGDNVVEHDKHANPGI